MRDDDNDDDDDDDDDIEWMSEIIPDKKMFIVIQTYAQISSVKLTLKLLRHISVLIHHLQGVYKLC